MVRKECDQICRDFVTFSGCYHSQSATQALYSLRPEFLKLGLDIKALNFNEPGNKPPNKPKDVCDITK